MPKKIIADGERKLHYSSFAPLQFLYLCKLTEVHPNTILHDFVLNISMENRGLGEQQRSLAMEYFIKCGYGQQFYSEDEIRKFMREMEALSSLFPTDCHPNFIDMHTAWREKYDHYWFEKWFYQVRRR